jgi:LysM repeat protein
MSKKTRTYTEPGLMETLLEDDRRRHHISMVTNEGEWNHPESSNGMARVFVIMLLVHVVIIGSVIIFDFIGAEDTVPPPPATARSTAPQQAAKASEVSAKAAAPAGTPAAGDSAAAPPATPGGVPDSGEIHIVQSGQNLHWIASHHEVDVADLITLNGLARPDASITPYMELRIPANKIDPAKAAAQAGVPRAQPVAMANQAPPAVLPVEAAVEDTPPAEPLPTVASLADTPPAAPVKEPETTPAAPEPAAPAPVAPAPAPVAQKPATPAPVAKPVSTPAKPATPPAAPATAAAKPGTHVMAKGDTLYSLSRRYKVSVTALQKANNITDPNSIREGARLVIPK